MSVHQSAGSAGDKTVAPGRFEIFKGGADAATTAAVIVLVIIVLIIPVLVVLRIGVRVFQKFWDALDSFLS